MKLSSIGTGFLSAALLCAPAAAFETDYAAGTGALPLQQSGGTARAKAMGSAVVAVDQGSASLLWNPAGLGRMKGLEAGLHHNTGLGDTLQEIAVVGLPLGPLGGVAASLGYVDYGSFGGRDATGQPTGSYRNGNLSASGGWGLQVLPGTAVGIELKANQSRFGSRVYSAYATDVGVLWSVMPRLDLGATYSNLNLGSKLSGSQLAGGWRLGAAFQMDRRLILAASGELLNSGMNRLQLGTEYLIGKLEEKAQVLALRAGCQIDLPDPQLTGMTALTFGLGYSFTRALALDYAIVPAGELGASHRLSLTFKLGQAPS